MEPYDDKIYSADVLGLSRPCPRCNEEMQSTGNLLHFKLPGRSKWGIEYRCANDGEVEVWLEQELRPLIEAAVRKAGKE